MIASSRRHMADMLEECMNRPRKTEDRQADKDSSYVKTYFLEALISESAKTAVTAKSVIAFLKKLSHPGITLDDVAGAKGDTLFTIQATVRSGSAQSPITLYLDYTNPRWWTVHSVSKTKFLDRFIKNLVGVVAELDRAWFPGDFLDSCTEMKWGKFRGLGLDYDKSWLLGDDDSDVTSSEVGNFKLNLRGRQASRVLRMMQRTDGLPNNTPLSRITIAANTGDCVDDVNYDGKVLGKGRSFFEHQTFSSLVYERYASEVRHIEKEYSIGRVVKDRVFGMEGRPICFTFETAIEDLALFCEKMFDGGAPFNLWGVPIKIRDGFWRVQSLDLHSSRTIAFELMPNLIRLYLPKGSCGNSVMRFYTNLQHGFDSAVKISVGNGEPALGFQS